MWVTGSYDIANNQVIWGTGNPVPMFDAYYRPGDNLYTNSVISWNPDEGKMNWYFQYTPGDPWDYDEAGTHILIDGQVGGETRKLITHSGRNGFLYTMERNNGQTVMVKPYLENLNWTKGVDPKTGKPVDYDPNKEIQIYAGTATPVPGSQTKKVCPSPSGGGISTPIERYVTELSAMDPLTGELKAKAKIDYPNYSGALSTAGGLVFSGFTDGSFIAYDDTTLEQLW